MADPNVIKEEGIEQSIRDRLSYRLEVGEITTLPAGSQASAEIVGTGPVQQLNLSLPSGPKGEDGADGADGLNGADGEDGEDGGIEEAPADGKQYVRKNLTWAEFNIPDEGVAEAPVDGKLYGRKNEGWEEIPTSTSPAVPPTKCFWSPRNVTNSFYKLNGVGNDLYVDSEISDISRDITTQVVTFTYTKPAGNFIPVVTASVYPRNTGTALHNRVVCLDWARSSSSSNVFTYRFVVLQLGTTLVDPTPITDSVLIKMEFVQM